MNIEKLINKEAEEQLIGSIMLDDSFDVSKIGIDLFYDSTCKTIFRKILAQYNFNLSFDLISISNLLSEKVSKSYITSLVGKSTSDIEGTIRTLEEKKRQRELHKIIDEVRRNIDGGVPSKETIENITKKIYKLSIENITTKHKTMRELIPDILNDMEENQKTGSLNGIKTGFKVYDELTGGLENGKLYLIAARPSMGKTTFMLNIADYIVRNTNKIIAIFSLETTVKDFGYRFLSAAAKISSRKLKSGKLTPNEWAKVTLSCSALNKNRINIINASGFTIEKIHDKIKEMKAAFGIDVVMIDYLQIIKLGASSRIDGVTKASGICKEIAMTLNIPVVLLSQLNRAVEARPKKRPMLSDLRDSGAIEQDADIVSFLYRDEYYNQYSDQQNLADIIIAKQKDGATGTIKLGFSGEYTRFYNLKKKTNE